MTGAAPAEKGGFNPSRGAGSAKRLSGFKPVHHYAYYIGIYKKVT
jgi:hypothetical protein